MAYMCQHEMAPVYLRRYCVPTMTIMGRAQLRSASTRVLSVPRTRTVKFSSKMLMPKKNRIAIYEHLFKEGVFVAKKDFHAAKHPEVDVPNLHVIKALQSLVSRGYVKEQFCWRHYYWYLQNEGIQYLRDFLHLPPEIVPATLKRQTRPEAARPRPKGADSGPRSQMNEDRAAYRRGGFGSNEKPDAGAGANPSFQFRGGFGRGGPAANQEQEGQ